MPAESSSTSQSDHRRPQMPYWLYSKVFWSGVSISTMWLAVLFVGVYGENFVVNSSNGITQIPVVVFVLPFVLAATIAVARRGFADSGKELAALRELQEPESGAQASQQPPDITAKAA